MHYTAERGVEAKDSMELGLGLGLGLGLSALRYDSCRDPVSTRHIFFLWRRDAQTIQHKVKHIWFDKLFSVFMSGVLGTVYWHRAPTEDNSGALSWYLGKAVLYYFVYSINYRKKEAD